MANGISKVMDLLTAVGCATRDEDFADSHLDQRSVGVIILRLDDELYCIGWVVLVEKRSYVLFELVVDTLARAEDKNRIVTLRPESKGSNMPTGTNAVLQTNYPLNDGDSADNVKHNHKFHINKSLSLWKRVG